MFANSIHFKSDNKHDTWTMTLSSLSLSEQWKLNINVCLHNQNQYLIRLFHGKDIVQYQK